MADGRIEFEETAVREFVSDHFEILREKENELITMCPFCQGGDHQEVSFNINPSTGAARCWRAKKCNWQGTVVRLIRDYLDCDWKTAYKIAGGEPPQDLDEAIGVINRKLSSIKPEHFSFSDGHKGKIDVFPKDATPLWESPHADEILDWLEFVRGYDPDEFLESHDLYTVEGVDWFRDRVLFRIRTGDHDAYLAYAYNTSIGKKTINPPGEVLSRMLYNYNEAKHGAIIFVTEGIFDAARCVERGFYAVSVFGVNLSLEQVFLLAATDAEEIVICFDEGTDSWPQGQENTGLPPAQKAASVLGKYIEDKKISYMSLDVEDADPDSIAEEDFIRCFMKRQRLIRDMDYVDYLVREL